MKMENISNEALSGKSLTEFAKTRSSQDTKAGFEAVFKKADERALASERKEPTPQRETQQKKARYEKDKPRGIDRKNEEGARKAQLEKDKDGTTEVRPTEIKSETVEEQTTGATSENDAKIVKKLSEELSVPEEEILQILNSLNISASELEDKSNMSAFLRELFGVSDNIELLEIPNINQIVQMANQIVSKCLEQGQDKVDSSVKFQTAQAGMDAEAEVDTMAADGTVKPEDRSILPNPTVKAQPQDEPQTNQPTVTTGESKTVTVETQIVVKTTTSEDSGNKKGGSEQNSLNQTNNPDAVNGMQTTVVSDKVQYTQTVAKTVASQNINTQDVVEQIINKMKVEIRGNISEVRLTLRPENLGDVSLRIATDNGIVTAHFVAESQRIKEIIESNFNNLKDVLQEQGIEVSSLSVSVGGNEQEQRMRQFLQGRSQTMARAGRIQGEGKAEESESAPAEIDTNEVYESSVDFSA